VRLISRFFIIGTESTPGTSDINDASTGLVREYRIYFILSYGAQGNKAANLYCPI
jgi:hypothetical protein